MKPCLLILTSLLPVALQGPAFSAVDSSRAQTQAAPAYLTILSAEIAEVPPLDWGRVSGRQVTLRIRLAGPPDCGPSASSLAYGFLIDADKDSSTGAKDPALADLGVDARVAAQCDQSTRTFVSTLGRVVMSTDAITREATIEIVTTADRLPSVDFHWIAYATEAGVVLRLPEAPAHGAWATIERTIR